MRRSAKRTRILSGSAKTESAGEGGTEEEEEKDEGSREGGEEEEEE